MSAADCVAGDPPALSRQPSAAGCFGRAVATQDTCPDSGCAARDDQHMTQPTLHTERLRLVPLADDHLEAEFELDSDPQVMRYITGRALSPPEVERAHRRRLRAALDVPGLGFWVGYAGGNFVGWWILQPPTGPDQPTIAREADLGYRLLHRHWRHGYASEGARELIRYGFADVGLNRIFAQTMAVNVASRATMATAGLTFTRAFFSAEVYDDPVSGAEHGEVEHEITRTTWKHGQGSRGTPAPTTEHR